MKSLKKTSLLTAFFALFLTFSVTTAFAQDTTEIEIQTQPETFTLEAEVTDWETGDVLADAEVIVVGNEDLNTVTDEEGMFTLENLQAGTYTLKVKLDGYQTWEKDIQVAADQELEIRLRPEIQ